MGADREVATCLLVYEDGSERQVTAIEAVREIERDGVQPFVAISSVTRAPIMRTPGLDIVRARALASGAGGR